MDRWLNFFKTGIVLSLLLFTLTSHAQDANYIIGPGDRIKVSIWQEDDLSGVYTVSNNGLMAVNWMAPIPVAGISVDDAQKRITTAVSQYVKNPIVTLSVAEFLSHKITVLGEVKRPGQYFLRQDSSLLTVLLKEVGGVNQNAGENLSILRVQDEKNDGKIETLSVQLSKLLQGDRSQNITLKNGDTLIVPRFDSKGIGKSDSDSILVVGEVGSPGSYKIREGDTVLTAILSAGNFTKFAAQNRVKVFRTEGQQKKEFIVKIKDVMMDGDKTKDMSVQSGDIIRVPKSIL